MTIDIKNLHNISFKEAMDKIASVVEDLGHSDCELEEMITLYEHGMILVKLCEEKLNNAKMHIEQINNADYSAVVKGLAKRKIKKHRNTSITTDEKLNNT